MHSKTQKVRFVKIGFLKRLIPFLKRLLPFLKKVDLIPKKVDLSISQQNHPITLKTFKTPKTFSTKNLHIRKFCSTFAP